MNNLRIILVVAVGTLLVILWFASYHASKLFYHADQGRETTRSHPTASPMGQTATRKLAAEKPQMEYPMGSEEAYNELLKKLQTLADKSLQGDLQARRELIAISKDPRLDIATQTYAKLVADQGTSPPPSKWEAVVKKAWQGDEHALHELRALAANDRAPKHDRELAICYLARDGKTESLIVVLQLVVSQDKDIRFCACSALPEGLTPSPVSRYRAPTEETRAVVSQLIERVKNGEFEWNQTELKWQRKRQP